VGNEVRKSNLEAMREQMALFKDKLEEFALNHRAEIRKDPAFRAQFHIMCANIGVDPLASNKASLDGFHALLGLFACTSEATLGWLITSQTALLALLCRGCGPKPWG